MYPVMLALPWLWCLFPSWGVGIQWKNCLEPHHFIQCLGWLYAVHNYENMEAFERNVSHFQFFGICLFLCVMNVISWSLWAICPGTRQPVMKLPLQHKGKISAIWLQRLIILALIALHVFFFSSDKQCT